MYVYDIWEILQIEDYIDEETDISDEELSEILGQLDFHLYWDNDVYDNSGNFILTDNRKLWIDMMKEMCCGIFLKEVKLSNGRIIYFAFDWGH